MLRRILTILLLLSFVSAGSGCLNDQEIIDKHEQMLEDEDE